MEGDEDKKVERQTRVFQNGNTIFVYPLRNTWQIQRHISSYYHVPPSHKSNRRCIVVVRHCRNHNHYRPGQIWIQDITVVQGKQRVHT